MRHRWCDHVAPVTAVVSCSGEEHRITWRRGKLVLEHHDLAAERTMMALGDPPCFCMQALKVWQDQWKMPPELFRQMGYLGPLGLPELAPVRQLAVARNWHRAWRRMAFLSKHGGLLDEQLQAAAVGPLRQHLTHWMPQLGCRMVSGAEVRLARSGATPGVVGSVDRVGIRASVVLEADWIVEVAATGLALVDGAFVLEVVDASDDGVAVHAVRWEAADGAPATPRIRPALAVKGEHGRWSLVWEE